MLWVTMAIVYSCLSWTISSSMRRVAMGSSAEQGSSISSTRRIEELMVQLKQEYTIAIVTHNMQQAQRVADITAFFSVDISKGSRTGYLVESGPTKQVFQEPREQLTKEYVSGQFS